MPCVSCRVTRHRCVARFVTCHTTLSDSVLPSAVRTPFRGLLSKYCIRVARFSCAVVCIGRNNPPVLIFGFSLFSVVMGCRRLIFCFSNTRRSFVRPCVRAFVVGSPEHFYHAYSSDVLHLLYTHGVI